MGELEQDTAVERVGGGTWRGAITDRWGIGGVPNGGYVLALAGRTMAQEVAPFEPLTITAHYLGVAKPAPVDVVVEVPKRGKRTATASARLVQEGREIARVLGTFGVLADCAPKIVYVATRPPQIPRPDACEGRGHPPAAVSIAQRFEVRVAPGAPELRARGAEGVAELAAWIRFADGTAPDPISLLLFADALPPPIFHVLPMSWVPTMELTVHVRARPAPGWLLCTFRTRLVAGDLLDEEGEIWDERGTLVAMSRQLARPPQ